MLCRAGTAVPLSYDHKPGNETEKRRIEGAKGWVTEAGRINGNLNLSRYTLDSPLYSPLCLPCTNIRNLNLSRAIGVYLGGGGGGGKGGG